MAGRAGHFTQRQYARIVAYARRRFVDVVPEIDMPGHVNAALASYGRLTATDVAPAPYTGIEVGLQLALHPEGADVRVHRRRRPRGRRADAGPVPPHRRRRGAVDRSRRLPLFRRARRSGSSVRTASAWSGGRRSRGLGCGGPRWRSTGTTQRSRDAPSSRARSSCSRPRRRTYLDMKYTPATRSG